MPTRFSRPLNPVAPLLARVDRQSVLPRTLTSAPPEITLGSPLIATFVVLICSGLLLVASDEFQHWFLFPVSACGVLVGIDAVQWLRGELDTYDPIGVLGLFGAHFFYVAPLLHVNWQLYIGDVAPPPDWRDWLGGMASLNVLGLIAYRLCRADRDIPPDRKARVRWRIDRQRIQFLAPVLLVVAAAAQILVYRRFGGIEGYMDAAASGSNPFAGMGWVFMISESFPILAAFYLITLAHGRSVGWPTIAGALLLGIAVQMFFGGLRGSRSQFVSALFWVVGCVHFMIRSISLKIVAVGSILVMAFIYVYGFYKAVGTEALQAFSGAEERAQLSYRTGRTFESALLGDLGRADVQAFVLYRLWNDGADFQQAWGRTYIASLSILVPHSLLSSRPEPILKEGTEIQTGAGTYVPQVWWSTRVYGLAGEAMLNFGPAAVPIGYGLLGLMVGRFRRWIRRLSPGDARFLLVPFGVYVCMTVLGGDSDNVVFGIAKDGLIPFLVVLTCSQRSRETSREAYANADLCDHGASF